MLEGHHHLVSGFNIYIVLLFAMLLKSDRPVRSGTGHSTGPDDTYDPLVHGTAQKTLKTALNRSEPVEPVNRWRF
jgi:hypothetical protein